jgi:hypothetical protein
MLLMLLTDVGNPLSESNIDSFFSNLLEFRLSVQAERDHFTFDVVEPRFHTVTLCRSLTEEQR